jgi:hypothetical protein
MRMGAALGGLSGNAIPRARTSNKCSKISDWPDCEAISRDNEGMRQLTDSRTIADWCPAWQHS